ncbi:hypothetical protein B0J13DRAFT_550230 [Dactylonectria estremocensis]|uniref:Uncharacterized protein n=1 Tax=Dactylonectria estremocensis TaxID=1079267 RepID=A0A9P9JAJ7_9HYPO|nr:hypothetical protein B0J13DRAFT_550230 [Dactylonectria estremocensis]
MQLWQVESGECTQEIWNAGFCNIRFDANDSTLLTEVGTISLQGPAFSGGNTGIPLAECVSGFGISLDGSWIMWQNRELFRIPREYFPLSSKIIGSTVIPGCSSGRVIIMSFANLEIVER